MTPRAKRLLVDVSQYANWPATSGVQRVLGHLATGWPSRYVDAHFGFVVGSRYVTGPIAALGAVIAEAFEASGADAPVTADSVRATLAARSQNTIRIDQVERTFAAYLLPEPTLCEKSVAVASQLLRSDRTTPFFIHYDALPLTHPQFYPAGADRNGIVTRYHSIVAKSSNVAFISPATQRMFEQRLARRALGNAIVIRPGADGLPRRPERDPGVPTFTVLGTVEPRKRHRLVLDAFNQLWTTGHDARLIVVGAPGWEKPDLLGELRDLSRTERVRWIERATDTDISNAIAQSSALIFVPYAEGYGLPALEALAAGCPVIVPGDLPALEGLPGDGQIRLETVSAHSVKGAVERLSSPSENTAYRDASRRLRLPTWKEFAERVERWIASPPAVDGTRGRTMSTESVECPA
jgi:hypothetical protein